MQHLRRTTLILVAFALCAAPAAIAHVGHRDRDAVVAPADKVAGLTGGELLGEAWFQLLSHPAGTFSGGCIPLGRTGRVITPAPGPDSISNCTVKRGTKVFLFFGAECSNVEPPPDFGADFEAQRACAQAAGEGAQTVRVTVDDDPPVDILRRRFDLLSPQRTVDLPPGNFLEVPPQTATFAAHAWGALVSKLRPGQHTIADEFVNPGFATSSTLFLDVTRGHRH
jgi:hypothetical protein